MTRREQRLLLRKLRWWLRRPELLGALFYGSDRLNRDDLSEVLFWVFGRMLVVRFLRDCTQRRQGARMHAKEVRRSFSRWYKLLDMPVPAPLNDLTSWLNEHSGLNESNREWPDRVLLPEDQWKPINLSLLSPPSAGEASGVTDGPQLSEYEFNWLNRLVYRRQWDRDHPKKLRYSKRVTGVGLLDNTVRIERHAPDKLVEPPKALESVIAKEELNTVTRKFSHGTLASLIDLLERGAGTLALETIVRKVFDRTRASNRKVCADTLVLVDILWNDISFEDARKRITGLGYKPSAVSTDYRWRGSIRPRPPNVKTVAKRELKALASRALNGKEASLYDLLIFGDMVLNEHSFDESVAKVQAAGYQASAPDSRAVVEGLVRSEFKGGDATQLGDMLVRATILLTGYSLRDAVRKVQSKGYRTSSNLI